MPARPDPARTSRQEKRQGRIRETNLGEQGQELPPTSRECRAERPAECRGKTWGSVTFSIWAAHRFRAGLRFGLRPSEWRGARFMYLEDGELALQVPNGKYSHGRAFGPTRTLIVDETRLQELDSLALESAA